MRLGWSGPGAEQAISFARNSHKFQRRKKLHTYEIYFVCIRLIAQYQPNLLKGKDSFRDVKYLSGGNHCRALRGQEKREINLCAARNGCRILYVDFIIFLHQFYVF